MESKKQLIGGLTFKYLKNDLPAGLVVFLVALPLCLGIALASGAPLFSGLIAGIVGGVVVAFASGSNLSVSGPAAGLTAIVLTSISDLGGYNIFLLSVVIGGILQIILGFLKAGIIGYYFPNSVIKGMLAAIGIILIRKQIAYAVGYEKPDAGNSAVPDGSGAGMFDFMQHLHLGAIIITIISLAILILWERPFLKKYTFFRLVPGALVIVIMGIMLNEWFLRSFPHLVLGGNHLVILPVAQSAMDFVSQFTIPDFSGLSNYKVYVVSVTLAIVASLESLLSVEAADKLDPYKRNTPTNRELKAQGFGNLVSGMIGGLPLTAVIVRTSANINAGAKTKISAIFHGLLLLLSVIAFAPLLNKIPLACLAALLLTVGYKLAKVSLFTSMYRAGWNQFLPFIITIVAIQFTDLLRGIAIGMAVAVFYILKNNYKSPYYFHNEDHPKGERIRIQLAEEVTFINKGSIALTLEHLPDHSSVLIDGSKSKNIDPDVLEMLQDFKENARLRHIKLEMKDIPEK